MGFATEFLAGPTWTTLRGTNGNHTSPILDLAQMAHVQPTFVEYISDLTMYNFCVTECSTSCTKL